MKASPYMKAADNRGIARGPLLKIIGLILVGLVAAQVATCENRLYAEPIEGVVVDEKTGKPIEGVVVVAWWQLTKWGMTHPRDAGTLMALEATTDSTGRYRIPGWGPRTWDEGAISERAPELFFFKSGYEPGGRNNTIYTDGRMPKAGLPPPGARGRASAWSGETITLRKSRDIESYARRLSILVGDIRSIRGGHCSWRSTLVAMNSELLTAARTFDDAGINPFFATSATFYFSFTPQAPACPIHALTHQRK